MLAPTPSACPFKTRTSSTSNPPKLLLAMFGPLEEPGSTPVSARSRPCSGTVALTTTQCWCRSPRKCDMDFKPMRPSPIPRTQIPDLLPEPREYSGIRSGDCGSIQGHGRDDLISTFHGYWS